jgi:hypothetical protein
MLAAHFCIITETFHVTCGQGAMLTPNPLLVPWSRKGRAIPVLPLWATRPVQSLSACTRVHFTFTFTFMLHGSLEINLIPVQYTPQGQVVRSVLAFESPVCLNCVCVCVCVWMCVPVTTAWRVLRLRMEERPPIWRVTVNILNKQQRTADKGWSSSLGVGQGANNPSP